MKIFKLLLLCIAVLFLTDKAFAAGTPRQYYLLRVYHYKTQKQEKSLDEYLEKAYKPAVTRLYHHQVGIFKTLPQDTDRRVYVFTIFDKWSQLENFEQDLAADKAYNEAGKEFLDASYNDVTYTRYEDIILHAFPIWAAATKPKTLSASNKDRVYELRSYEGPTEKYYWNKVKMFNDGNEPGIFDRLNFNGVFYASVVAGSHQPNLMYMTTFNSKDDREKHWQAFNNDAEWKVLSAKPEYQHNVSKADIIFLYPADYSDF